MIRPNCAQAADEDRALARPDYTPPGHAPTTCRDAAIQPHGCTCQHGPVTQPEETR